MNSRLHLFTFLGLSAALAGSAHAAQSCHLGDGVSPYELAWSGDEIDVEVLAIPDFVGPPLIWSCGDGGRIRHSADGGLTWELQATPNVQVPLRDIEFRNRWDAATSSWTQVGMAVGDEGVVLRTEDGGASWTSWAPVRDMNGNPTRLWSVYMDDLDLDEVWIAGLRVLRYSGAGDPAVSGVDWAPLTVQNETVTPLMPGNEWNWEWYKLDFFRSGSERIGVVGAELLSVNHAAHESAMFRASLTAGGGGGTWISVTALPDEIGVGRFEPYDVEVWKDPSQAVDNFTAYMVGGVQSGHGRWYKSSDGGQSWQREWAGCETPGCGEPHATALNCTIPTCESGPVCCAGCSNCLTQYATGCNDDSQYGVAVLDADTALSVGYGGSVKVRRLCSAGSSAGVWIDRRDRCNYSTPLQGAEVYGQDSVLAVGTFGYIRQTTAAPAAVPSLGLGDPGTWTNLNAQSPVNRSQNTRLIDLAAAGQDTLIAVGQYANIMRSTDGGCSWQNPDPATFGWVCNPNINGHGESLNAVAFEDSLCSGSSNALVGVTGGQGHRLFASADSGSSWSEVDFADIEWAPSPAVAPLISDAFEITDVAYSQLHDVPGIDEHVFYAVTDAGYVLRSKDAGNTWKEVIGGRDPDGLGLVTWNAVAATDYNAFQALLVGERNGAGVGFHVKQAAGAAPVWSAIQAANSWPPLLDVKLRRGASAAQFEAYAVGKNGVALQIIPLSPGFKFVDSPAMLLTLASNPELNAIGLPHHPLKDVYLGGFHGYLLAGDSNGSFQQRNPQTNKSLLAFAFPCAESNACYLLGLQGPGNDFGFLATTALMHFVGD